MSLIATRVVTRRREERSVLAIRAARWGWVQCVVVVEMERGWLVVVVVVVEGWGCCGKVEEMEGE